MTRTLDSGMTRWRLVDRGLRVNEAGHFSRRMHFPKERAPPKRGPRPTALGSLHRLREGQVVRAILRRIRGDWRVEERVADEARHVVHRVAAVLLRVINDLEERRVRDAALLRGRCVSGRRVYEGEELRIVRVRTVGVVEEAL